MLNHVSLIWNAVLCDTYQGQNTCSYPDSKVHRAYMGPTWGRPDVGPMNLAIRVKLTIHDIPPEWVKICSWHIAAVPANYFYGTATMYSEYGRQPLSAMIIYHTQSRNGFTTMCLISLLHRSITRVISLLHVRQGNVDKTRSIVVLYCQ